MWWGFLGWLFCGCAAEPLPTRKPGSGVVGAEPVDSHNYRWKWPFCPFAPTWPLSPRAPASFPSSSITPIRNAELRNEEMEKKNPLTLDNFFCTSFEVSCTFNLWLSAGPALSHLMGTARGWLRMGCAHRRECRGVCRQLT